MDFWNEYFKMKAQEPVDTEAGAILRLSCLEMAAERWNPNYARDKARERFNPLHPVSKRKLRYLRILWAIRKGAVAK